MAYLYAMFRAVVAVWLACQMLTGMLATVIVSEPDRARDAMACACPRGDSRQCPMHKTAGARSECQLRGAADTTRMSAAGFFEILGLPALVESLNVSAIGRLFTQLGSTLLDCFLPPVSPPPRLPSNHPSSRAR